LLLLVMHRRNAPSHPRVLWLWLLLVMLVMLLRLLLPMTVGAD
jgi:hypothetical protein